LLTKNDIDSYFTSNWKEIQIVVKQNAPKCATKNPTDITSDIYLICVEKSSKIKSLAGFIRILASNIYRWQKSDFNINNKIFANEIEFNTTYDDNDIEDEIFQNRLFALEKYKLNAKTHEKIFLETYIDKNIRTVRGIEQELGVSFHGAYTLIKDFKLKIKEYERQE
jgi:hypothetical protein